VRLRSGGLAGLVGTVQCVRGDRVEVAVRAAGRELRQLVSRDQVELVPIDPVAERRRALARRRTQAARAHARAWWAAPPSPDPGAAWDAFSAAQPALREALDRAEAATLAWIAAHPDAPDADWTRQLDRALPCPPPPEHPDAADRAHTAARRAAVARRMPRDPAAAARQAAARAAARTAAHASHPDWLTAADAFFRGLDDDEADLLDWPLGLEPAGPLDDPPDPAPHPHGLPLLRAPGQMWVGSAGRLLRIPDGGAPEADGPTLLDVVAARIEAAMADLDAQGGAPDDLADRLWVRLSRLAGRARAATAR